MMAKLIVEEDSNLAKNFKTSPMTFMKNLSLTSSIKFSKDFYALMNKEAPITILANSFAREDGDKLVFDMKLNNGHISVNNKVIN